MVYSYNYKSPHVSSTEPKKIIPIRIYLAPVVRIYKSKIIRKVIRIFKNAFLIFFLLNVSRKISRYSSTVVVLTNIFSNKEKFSQNGGQTNI